jgi:hypothetical protein
MKTVLHLSGEMTMIRLEPRDIKNPDGSITALYESVSTDEDEMPPPSRDGAAPGRYAEPLNCAVACEECPFWPCPLNDDPANPCRHMECEWCNNGGCPHSCL